MQKGRSHLLRHHLPPVTEARILQHYGTTDAREIHKEVARMGQKELQAKFADVYSCGTSSNNNSWLRRKLLEAAGLQIPKVVGTGSASPRRGPKQLQTAFDVEDLADRAPGEIRRTKRIRKPKQFSDMLLFSEPVGGDSRPAPRSSLERVQSEVGLGPKREHLSRSHTWATLPPYRSGAPYPGDGVFLDPAEDAWFQGSHGPTLLPYVPHPRKSDESGSSSEDHTIAFEHSSVLSEGARRQLRTSAAALGVASVFGGAGGSGGTGAGAGGAAQEADAGAQSSGLMPLWDASLAGAAGSEGLQGMGGLPFPGGFGPGSSSPRDFALSPFGGLGLDPRVLADFAASAGAQGSMQGMGGRGGLPGLPGLGPGPGPPLPHPPLLPPAGSATLQRARFFSEGHEPLAADPMYMLHLLQSNPGAPSDTPGGGGNPAQGGAAPGMGAPTSFAPHLDSPRGEPSLRSRGERAPPPTSAGQSQQRTLPTRRVSSSNALPAGAEGPDEGGEVGDAQGQGGPAGVVSVEELMPLSPAMLDNDFTLL